MLDLETEITLNLATIQSPNLCDKFSDEDLAKIGNWCLDNYKRDLASREPWFRRTESAMDLAMQIQKDKTFPWMNCSNITFPLVTIAALQFHARAYPAIVNGRSVVQCRVIGADPDGAQAARAERVSRHMSWQLLEQDESWEEQQDRALLNVPIVGTAFKKSYYDASVGHNKSDLVLAKDLVLDYWAKSVDSCPVKTHVIQMYRNEIHERIMRDTFRDVSECNWYIADAVPPNNQQIVNHNQRAGMETPQSSDMTPFTLGEQHCSLDLDCDGYAEPYVITFEISSGNVLRICCRFDREEDIEKTSRGEIIKIYATEYFTKMPFIPSPDGGIMDIGFGVLLGPLNESTNSIINQLVDSGTISNTAGGFLGRGAKIRGGVYNFSPFGWQRVDSTGDDLRKNVFPLPVREPSAVLFNLLNLLIDYTSRISGATDMLTGVNPGQNTPAETARSMTEQGQKVYSAIFKRTWRSMKQEFKKLYQLNAVHLSDDEIFGTGTDKIGREDYLGDPGTVVPVADPTISSEGARFAQANLLKAAAASNPGYNMDEVEKRYLKCLGIDEIDLLYPGQAAMPPPGPTEKEKIQQMKSQDQQAKLQVMQMQFIATLRETQRVNSAKIVSAYADAAKATEEAKGVQTQQVISAFNASIAAMKTDNENLETQINKVLESMEGSNESSTSGTSTNSGSGNVSGVASTSSDSSSA